jgi:hypothetical protein
MSRTIELTAKDTLMKQLAETRYGVGAEPISRTTFWRWCTACGVSSGKTHYHPDETLRLHQFAQGLSDGQPLPNIFPIGDKNNVSA